MTEKNYSLLAIVRADRQLDAELRARLVSSLFVSPRNIAAAAFASSGAGIGVAISTTDPLLIMVGCAVPVLGALRVAHAVFEKRRRHLTDRTRAAELIYEAGAWTYSALLGLLSFLVLTRTTSEGLHLLVACVAVGYSAATCVRNAGRPAVALGQLTLSGLPLSLALGVSSDPPRLILAGINVIFILGLVDITRKIYFALHSSMSVSRAREEELKETLDHMPQMAWSADSQGAFTHYSRRWTEFTGSSPLDSGGSRAALVHPDDWPDFLTMWNHSVETGSRFEAQYRLRHRSGKYRWVLSLGMPERDERGRVVRWHGTCTDVHDKQLAQYAPPAAASVRAAWP